MGASSSFGRLIGGPSSTRWARIEAVLFDLDGTLVEPGIDFGAMHDRVVVLARAYGHVLPDGARLPALETITATREALSRVSPERARAFAADAHSAITAVEVEAAGRVRPYPGVAEMLDAMARGSLRIGIVTRNCRLAVEALLARHRLHYDVLLTRDDVAHVKPDPRHLLAALERLGIAPEWTLMVGDHAMDIVAGRAIGAVTVGVCPAGSSRDAFDGAQPDLILASAADLAGYLCTDEADRRAVDSAAAAGGTDGRG